MPGRGRGPREDESGLIERPKKAPPERGKWTIDERLTKASLPRLWADAIKSGRPLGADAVVIADELGGLTFVPMADALPKRPT